MNVVEDVSGIDVDDMLQLRKKKQFFVCLFFDMLLHVFDLVLPSKFDVDNETW